MEEKNKKFNIKQILLTAVTLIFLYLVFVNININETINIIKNFNLKYIIFLVLSIIISLSFRGLCFKQLLSNSIKIPLKELIQLCITGAALNIVLPARAGDLFRAYYVGDKYETNKVKIFGTIMLERILDGFTIGLMLLIAILFYNNNPLAQKLCISSFSLFFLCLIIAFIAFKFYVKKLKNEINTDNTDQVCDYIQKHSDKLLGKFNKLIKKGINFFNKTCSAFFHGFEILQYPQKFITIFISVLGIWFFECLNYYIVILGFGCDVHWSVILYIISFIALSSMIPSTSIFIGPYQFAVITAFSIYNINKETALAISIVEQTIVTITTAVIAFIFLFKKNISYKEIKKI